MHSIKIFFVQWTSNCSVPPRYVYMNEKLYVGCDMNGRGRIYPIVLYLCVKRAFGATECFPGTKRKTNSFRDPWSCWCWSKIYIYKQWFQYCKRGKKVIHIHTKRGKRLFKHHGPGCFEPRIPLAGASILKWCINIHIRIYLKISLPRDVWDTDTINIYIYVCMYKYIYVYASMSS
jgi:hypothetical protein